MLLLLTNLCVGLKKDRLDFMAGWVTQDSLMMEQDEPEVDVLTQYLDEDSRDVFERLMDILGDDEDVDQLSAL
jgi:hypothetical protein